MKRLKTMLTAKLAAASQRWPARGLQIILVTGQDGAQLTVAYLAAILQQAGAKVGVVTQTYVQIDGEYAKGSDQADILGDPFRLQKLLAHMKRAGCQFAVIEVPPAMPAHQFHGIVPALLAVRRCGDSHGSAAGNAQVAAMARRLLALNPRSVVINRDDPACDAFKDYLQPGPGLMTVGVHPRADCKLTDVQLHPKGSATRLLIDHQTELQLATHLAGKQTIYSMATAAAAAYLLHVSITAIEDGIMALPPQPANLQFLPVARPYQVVVDCAVTPDGIADTLETLRHFAKNRLIAVVGANLAQPIEWLPVLGELAAKNADRLVVCDGDFAPTQSPQVVRNELLKGVEAAGAEARTEEVAERQAAFEKALSIARRGDIVVVLASSQRPYYQHGNERVVWDDASRLRQLVE